MTTTPVWPRCTGCNSRLNSWRILLCHNCQHPQATTEQQLNPTIAHTERSTP